MHVCGQQQEDQEVHSYGGDGGDATGGGGRSSSLVPLLSACAAAVSSDGRLGLLAVPSPEVWRQVVLPTITRTTDTAAATLTTAAPDGGGGCREVLSFYGSGDVTTAAAAKAAAAAKTQTARGDTKEQAQAARRGCVRHDRFSFVIRRACCASCSILPRFLVPGLIAFVEHLPLTATGKVRGSLVGLQLVSNVFDRTKSPAFLPLRHSLHLKLTPPARPQATPKHARRSVWIFKYEKRH